MHLVIRRTPPLGELEMQATPLERAHHKALDFTLGSSPVVSKEYVWQGNVQPMMCARQSTGVKKYGF